MLKMPPEGRINCFMCLNLVNPKKGVTCDQCKKPLHAVCARLSEQEVSLLKSKNRHLLFICKHCNRSRNMEELKELKQHVLSLRKDLKDLERRTNNAANSTGEPANPQQQQQQQQQETNNETTTNTEN